MWVLCLHVGLRANPIDLSTGIRQAKRPPSELSRAEGGLRGETAVLLPRMWGGRVDSGHDSRYEYEFNAGFS